MTYPRHKFLSLSLGAINKSSDKAPWISSPTDTFLSLHARPTAPPSSSLSHLDPPNDPPRPVVVYKTTKSIKPTVTSCSGWHIPPLAKRVGNTPYHHHSSAPHPIWFNKFPVMSVCDCSSSTYSSSATSPLPHDTPTIGIPFRRI